MATQVTVTGRHESAPGVPSTGSVEARYPVPLYSAAGNLIVGTAPITTTLAADGSWSLNLWATDDPDTYPTGQTVRFTFYVDNQSWSNTWVIPHVAAPTVVLDTLTPAGPAPAGQVNFDAAGAAAVAQSNAEAYADTNKVAKSSVGTVGGPAGPLTAALLLPSAQSRAIATVSGAASLAAQTQLVVVNSSAGAYTLTLPDATTCLGAEIALCKTSTDTNVVTVSPSGSQTIGGYPANGILTAHGDTYRLVSDGTADWKVIDRTLAPWVFTTSGNWYCPAGVLNVEVELRGGGGGGAGGGSAGSLGGPAGGGCGGGGGAYLRSTVPAVPGSITSVSIGAGQAGSAGGAAGGNNGVNNYSGGGTTNFGGIAASGGGGGYAGQGNSNPQPGGLYGQPRAVNSAGYSFPGSGWIPGCGGSDTDYAGAAVGPIMGGCGGRPPQSNTVGGYGGAAGQKGAGVSVLTPTQLTSTANGAAGQTATEPGCGGGGGGAGAYGGAGGNGGNGAPGQVTITAVS